MKDENQARIISESNKTISKLHLLSVFFGDDMIYKIYLRTQVIHRLFETNPELDISKLELFHIQYTVTIIDLLKRIKTSNEKNVSLLLDEISLNKEMISKIGETIYTEQSFRLDKQRQALKVNLSLRKLYQLLSEDKDESPFSKNINSFSAHYAADFFFEIPYTLFEEVTTFSPNDVYRNNHATIQRKLMGILCKVDFKSEFVCGVTAGTLVLEIYHIPDEDRHFLYSPSRNLFLFFDMKKIAGIDHTADISKKGKIVRELQDKNDQLQSAASISKTLIPTEIKTLISQYYEKIEDVNFLDKLTNLDIQANILKTMLNTNSI
jgi:hypothetical protein